ncbi:putative ATP-dependent RNA helicase rhlE [Asticcacaulis biprosthecium C19]|uniref:DEAD-box ATP-dependent RNA helicase RhpA n=1 Tax=Asticcacaulis biprosthecium C19 TaxID=715226 RepID=F4QLU5_9CAUL|nr:DEAD/DEAH box helicase [Asticcacaulis biprosthecium]EGF92364.1 putative ATP-dependent RNA helicase rhlE [Asticcacaulis biprosthecium C19]
MTKFSDLGLSPTLLMTLEREGYEKPTPVQAQAIPYLLKGHDLLGIAQTGTGKTAAFALPILQHLLSNRKMPSPKMVRALILSPTRELASQIAESFKTYSKGMGLQIATIYGGVKYGPQYKALLGGLDVLVCTPGRLIDHIEQKTVDLSQVECFVLDEADQMLDLGFVKPIRQVASRLPKKRQNLFFSATMPKEIGVLASELLTDPKRVEITPEATTAERVSQQVLFIEAQRKRALLSEMYADAVLERTLVFTRTKRSADRVAAYLQAGGVEAAAIHGDKNQSQRERALQAFRAGKVRALVATDIAARGIDVDNVSHVINYELPNVAEAYVHRIGRTARAGKSGVSITLCADDERRLLKDIERVTRQRIPSFDRRKDQALKLLDEAILASGQTEKPSTPDRLPEHRKKGDPKPGQSSRRDDGPRHSDPDAEFVHKRSRNRTGSGARGGRPFADKKPFTPRDGDAKPFVRAEPRADRYDPMATERGPIAATSNGPAKPEGKFLGKKPFKKDWSKDAPRGDRREHAPREHAPREHASREHASREHASRDHAPRTEGRTDDRRGPKPANRGPKTGGFKAGGFKGNANPAHYSEAPKARTEGAQFKRRSKG